MMAKACVFMFHKTHAISHLGCFQSCRLVKYMNIFEKEKKIISNLSLFEKSHT